MTVPRRTASLPLGLSLSTGQSGTGSSDDDTTRQRDTHGNRNGFEIEIDDGMGLQATPLAPVGA